MGKILLPKHYGQPHKQRGIICATAVYGSSEPTLDAGDGGDVQRNDFSAPYDSTVAIRFNANGTVETGRALDGAAITWSDAGVWIIPSTEASSVYDVRFTNLTVNSGGSDWSTEAAADNIWINLGTARTWSNNRTGSGLFDFDCDFEVRDGGGAPPATASRTYGFIINNSV